MPPQPILKTTLMRKIGIYNVDLAYSSIYEILARSVHMEQLSGSSRIRPVQRDQVGWFSSTGQGSCAVQPIANPKESLFSQTR
ncbi:hypothetical protein U1Q18_031188 [Sarracenia purpurea var. burkii]